MQGGSFIKSFKDDVQHSTSETKGSTLKIYKQKKCLS